MTLLHEVSTEQIESAIQSFKTGDFGKTVHFYTYSSSASDRVITEGYTISDLYRELARRHDDGIKVIRDVLKEFED